ncbi:MAG TPA: hypothetical protein VMZ22_04435 [Acidimicrobiales bacterium]|nr:hypothetical protein [Acidimicrobiales bacterium]
MSVESDPAFITLHVLRVRGVTGTEEVAVATRLDEVTVDAAMAEHRARELVVLRTGNLPGWALTRLGRDEDAQLAANELDAAGHRRIVDALYRSFLELNPALLLLCTDWQLLPIADNKTPPELNRHDDPAYDAEVLARLAKVDSAVQPICAGLADALARFGGYGPRLAAARARVEAGEHEWMTKPMIDSYHSVWFELHEDLLATLGIERGSEPGPAGDEAKPIGMEEVS